MLTNQKKNSALKKYVSMIMRVPAIDRTLMLYVKKSNNTQEYVTGHLMMDEVRLKNSIIWNCMNNIVTIFVGEEIDTKGMTEIFWFYLRIKYDKKTSNIYKPMAVYINQGCYA